LSLAVKLNRKQFEGLALEQLDTLYRVARRLTGDPGRAQDLVQETYLRALRGAADFKLEDFGIRPWLLRIMQNLHTSRGERESRQPRAMDDQHLAAFAHEAPTPAPPTDDGQALFDSMDEQLVAALEHLPPEYQQVMLLWAVEDLSYREIAAALDVPIGTVMSRLYRARQSLSQQLREYAQRQRLIRE
jgi:RNA polymerase sigma-70 factor (ECF subfamily)